jgi:hypothetical protein
VTRPTKRTANIRKLNTNKPTSSIPPFKSTTAAAAAAAAAAAVSYNGNNTSTSMNQNASCSFDLLNEIEKLQDVFFNDDNSLLANTNNNTNATNDSPPAAAVNRRQQQVEAVKKYKQQDLSAEPSGEFKLSDQELLGYLESISSFGKSGSPMSIMTQKTSHNDIVNDDEFEDDGDDEGLPKDLDEDECASNRNSNNRKSLSYYTTQSFHMNTSVVSPGREMLASSEQMSMIQVQQAKKLHSKLPCSPTEKLRKSMSMPRLSLVSSILLFSILSIKCS